MTPRRRTIGLVATALVTTVALVTFLPNDESPRASIVASATGDLGTQYRTAGAGAVTPAMQREIDRVVSAGSTQRLSARSGPASLAAQARCAEFEGQRYCLGQGWTTDTEDEVQARLSTTLRSSARRAPVEQTGDLDPLEALRARAGLPTAARARLDRAELTEAAKSVAKVWLLRHEIQGVPLPRGFLQRHPEVRTLSRETTTATPARSVTQAPGTTTTATLASSTTTTATAKTNTDYPRRDTIISSKKVSEQTRSYWCGPATMQMIAWGWRGYKQGQWRWAKKLGTTTSGTAITDMVRVVNGYTGWDRADHAGRYVALDIGSWEFKDWYRLIMRHITDYNAPVVMHPVLEKQYYSYLDDDASGHFQMGRGYARRWPDAPNQVSYFEPWNQQRFDPSEPYIKRLQWYSAYKQYRANKAHFQHNIGV